MAKKKNPINVLGVKLKNGRENRGLSQEEIAIKLADFGVTVRDVDDWENGYDMPKETLLYELAHIYRLNAAELVQIKKDLEFAGVQKNQAHRRKFVGRTFWEVFGDLIVKLLQIGIIAGIIFVAVKTDIFHKIMSLDSGANETEENFIVDDEYLRMLNSKHGSTDKNILNP